jgi:hypothetical protein
MTIATSARRFISALRRAVHDAGSAAIAPDHTDLFAAYLLTMTYLLHRIVTAAEWQAFHRSLAPTDDLAVRAPTAQEAAWVSSSPT